MIRTAWILGARPELADLRLRAWAQMLGFRGHFSTKSRRYSTTLGRPPRRPRRMAPRPSGSGRRHRPGNDSRTRALGLRRHRPFWR